MITVTDVIEHEDGSADIQFELEHEDDKKHLLEEGVNFLLLKAAYNVTTSDITSLLEEHAKPCTQAKDHLPK
jgi:hypothetical protein